MLRVTEIFHSIQGESSYSGSPCVFVRLTGCPLRCRWCDTSYAFQGGTSMGIEEVLEAVAAFDCPTVEVTGGEPLAQPESLVLLERLSDAGFDVLLETSGALDLAGVDRRVTIIMDLKCPDSGESERNLWDNLPRLKPNDEIKFVVASRGDFEWALDQVRTRDLSTHHTVFFSPVWGDLEPRLLAGWVLEESAPVRLQIQIHKVLFGPEERGV